MNPDQLMRSAIQISEKGMKSNQGGPFGAIVVLNGKVVGQGSNQVTSDNDPTAHAEMVAIRNACKALGTFKLEGAEIYCSCEPCPMCLSAIYWARIDKVYFANTRKDAANIGFDDDLIYSEVPKALDERKIPFIQILRDEANQVFEAWSKKTDKVDY